MKPSIRVTGLGRRYARYAKRRQFATLKSALLGGSIFTDLAREESFAAIEDVSFSIEPGSTVAVIGPNGSGKSTLLKMLAGILAPTSGSMEVNGRVAALLELGAGFHPEISGRENIIINGIMLGLSRREVESRIDDIIRFAELEEFIDAPVKTYSSGMYVRLGFAVAVAVEPDVLLVDEVLAVGDEAFSHKCLDRFHDLKRRGRTVLVVTHALELAETLADSIILLEEGRLVAHGAPREVIDLYRSHVADREQATAVKEETTVTPELEAGEVDPTQPDNWQPRRWGTGAVQILGVTAHTADGEPRTVFATGDAVTIAIEIESRDELDTFAFGVAFHDRDGRLAYGTNTDIERFKSERMSGKGTVRLSFPNLALIEGSYSVDVAVHTPDGLTYDYRQACLTIRTRSDVKDAGVARLEHAWSFDGGISME